VGAAQAQPRKKRNVTKKRKKTTNLLLIGEEAVCRIKGSPEREKDAAPLPQEIPSD